MQFIIYHRGISSDKVDLKPSLVDRVFVGMSGVLGLSGSYINSQKPTYSHPPRSPQCISKNPGVSLK